MTAGFGECLSLKFLRLAFVQTGQTRTLQEEGVRNVGADGRCTVCTVPQP